LDETNVDDLVKENLLTAEAKLEVLDEQHLGVALGEFVEKEQNNAYDVIVDKIIMGQSKKLKYRGISPDAVEGPSQGDDKLTTSAAVREICMAESERIRQQSASDIDKGIEARAMAARQKKMRVGLADGTVDKNDSKKSETARAIQTIRVAPSRNRNNKAVADDSNDDLDEDVIDVSVPRSTKPTPRSARKVAASSNPTGRYSYNDDIDGEYLENGNGNVSSEIEEDEDPPPKRIGKAAGTQSARTMTTGIATSRKTAARKPNKRPQYQEHSDEDDGDDDDDARVVGLSFVGGWGTAAESQASKRIRR